jgi:hypothetical protein
MSVNTRKRMTEHHLGTKVHLYPDEFHVVLKLMNRAIDNKELMDSLTEDETHILDSFIDYFMDVALEHSA